MAGVGDNTRKIHQLVATGESAAGGWRFTARSQDVFLSQEDAEAHIPEFTRRCCDPEFFDYAIKASLRVTVMSLKLHG